ncbi:hypothetical protein ACJX0J_033794, partial [Zea mays]
LLPTTPHKTVETSLLAINGFHIEHFQRQQKLLALHIILMNHVNKNQDIFILSPKTIEFIQPWILSYSLYRCYSKIIISRYGGEVKKQIIICL